MNPDTARIHDQGYRPFKGKLGSVRTRFWPIAVNELRLSFRNKWFKRLLWASFFPLGVFSVLVLLRHVMESMLGPSQVWQNFWRTQLLFAVVAAYFTGRRAVGEDLRSGALTLYFSRAVDFRQYLLGKWLAVALSMGGVLLGPGLLLLVFSAAMDPDLPLSVALSWGAILIALSLLFALSAGWVVLAISSLAGRGRAAGIVWVVVYFASSAAAVALSSALNTPDLVSLGIGDGSMRLANELFSQHADLATCMLSLAGQVAWAILGALVVLLRLARWRRL